MNKPYTVRRFFRNGVVIYQIAIRGVKVVAGSTIYYDRESAQREADFRNRREGRVR